MGRLKFLFTKYKNAESTPRELDELLDIFVGEDNAAPLMEEIQKVFDDDFTDSPELTEAVELVYCNLHRDIFSESQRKNTGGLKLIWLKRFAVAASVVLVTGLGYLYYSRNANVKEQGSVYTNEVKPGGNKAILKLANGKSISLNGSKKGIIIDASKLSYNDGTNVAEEQSEKIQMLTIETPKGGQYEATLPDGTHIWLNADTKLSFPSEFTGGDRTVNLSGEAYFQVAHNKAKPFIVISNGQEVEVLGTHFNVNAYKEEDNIKTTLLKGSVRVSYPGTGTGSKNINEVILKPKEQSSVKIGTRITVRTVDINETIAWKDGYFRFNDEGIESIMRKLSRWYNIDVTFDQLPTKEGFNGKISRYKSITQVLKMLEETNVVRFKIDGRRVFVSAI